MMTRGSTKLTVRGKKEIEKTKVKDNTLTPKAQNRILP